MLSPGRVAKFRLCPLPDNSALVCTLYFHAACYLYHSIMTYSIYLKGFLLFYCFPHCNMKRLLWPGTNIYTVQYMCNSVHTVRVCSV
jgi:hypothetical protein